MSQPDTKQRILDAAERLFATDGFHATSMRMITGLAAVNLAAINYHFGSKEELLAAVIDRRLVPLNAERNRLLEEELARARRQGRRPFVRELMRAMVAPTVALRGQGEGPEHFITLVGRILADPQGIGRDLFIERMGPFLGRLYQALQQALPEADPDLLLWRLHFAIGALGHVMRCHDRHLKLPMPVNLALAPEALTESLLDFIVAGMEASQ
ncbi:MAG: TetR/AcrR family transcriptional regulator [Geothermobacteraceae bacterium]